MAIRLEKGGQSHTISISKLRVGLGWEPNEDESDYPYDLDVSAFMLGTNKKIPKDEYLVFFGSENRVLPTNLLKIEMPSEIKYPEFIDEGGETVNSYEHWRRKTRPVDPEFSIHGSLDDMDGEVSDGGDDETINIDLKKVHNNIQEILITVTIYDFSKRRQNFGQVNESYVSIYNEVNQIELFKFELSQDFKPNTAMEFCSIYRDNGGWKVKAVGEGYQEGIDKLVELYTT